jgi:gluconolactonase
MLKVNRTRISLLVLLLFVTQSFAQNSSDIVEDGTRFEVVFSGGFWLEGPAVAPDGSVYFSDITYSNLSGMQAGHIWRYDPKTGDTAIFRSPSGMSNGIIFDAQGDMLVAEGADFGGRRVTRTKMSTGKSYIVAGLHDGRRLNSPNDIAIDDKGRIYFTDPRYTGHEAIEQPVMGIYRVDPDSSIHLLAANVWMPNGIAVSPDQSTLFVVSTGSYSTNIADQPAIGGGPLAAIHAYDLIDDGSLQYRGALVTLPEENWGDGMTVDRDGNIYLGVGSLVGKDGVYVYSPEGDQLAYLPTPETAVNLEFGRGEDSNLLYVTCSRHPPPGVESWDPPATNGLYRIRLKKRGYHPTAPK